MFEVWLVLVLVSMACSLIGSVLVLQERAMLADALSHSVLLGIVLGYFVSQDLHSPLLVLGAGLFGVLSVGAIELLHSRKITHDAATGLVFSFFFAVAVLLISIFARNVHLDIDMVLMGEVLFVPFHRMVFLGQSVPVSLVKIGLILLVNGLFFLVCYQPLKLHVFDRTQAQLIGVSVRGLQVLILLLVSFTTVLSFDAIGSMTVVVFLLAPTMTILPWVRSFAQLLLGGVLLSVCLATVSYGVAMQLDLTLAGTCAVVSLLAFCSSLVVKSWRKT